MLRSSIRMTIPVNGHLALPNKNGHLFSPSLRSSKCLEVLCAKEHRGCGHSSPLHRCFLPQTAQLHKLHCLLLLSSFESRNRRKSRLEMRTETGLVQPSGDVYHTSPTCDNTSPTCDNTSPRDPSSLPCPQQDDGSLYNRGKKEDPTLSFTEKWSPSLPTPLQKQPNIL